jgi:predicted SAM-dependent methyltransferase
METCQISYKVLFHIKGYIRLEVPLLKKLSWAYLYNNFKNPSRFPIPSGIKNYHLNPLNGSMVITYEPDINIFEYIKNMATAPDIKNIIEG